MMTSRKQALLVLVSLFAVLAIVRFSTQGEEARGPLSLPEEVVGRTENVTDNLELAGRKHGSREAVTIGPSLTKVQSETSHADQTVEDPPASEETASVHGTVVCDGYWADPGLSVVLLKEGTFVPHSPHSPTQCQHDGPLPGVRECYWQQDGLTPGPYNLVVGGVHVQSESIVPGQNRLATGFHKNPGFQLMFVDGANGAAVAPEHLTWVGLQGDEPATATYVGLLKQSNRIRQPGEVCSMPQWPGERLIVHVSARGYLARSYVLDPAAGHVSVIELQPVVTVQVTILEAGGAPTAGYNPEWASHIALLVNGTLHRPRLSGMDRFGLLATFPDLVAAEGKWQVKLPELLRFVDATSGALSPGVTILVTAEFAANDPPQSRPAVIEGGWSVPPPK